MLKHVRRRTTQAYLWLVGGVLVWIFLFALASRNSSNGSFDAYGEWTTRDAAVLAEMILLLGAASLMHWCDWKFHGRGFRDLWGTEGGAHEPEEQNFVGPVVAAESIRVAMTAGILAILLDDRKDYLPNPDAELYWRSVREIFAEPKAVFFLSIVVALTASLMTTMAALLCYEYASRFRWSSRWPKIELLNKGRQFGTFGFYCLMWSLAVVAVLLHYHLAFISTFFVFYVMWFYYFFPAKKPSTESVEAVEALVRNLFRAENGSLSGKDVPAADILAPDYLPITRANGQVDQDQQDTLQKITYAPSTFVRHVDGADINVSLFMNESVAIARTYLPTTDKSTSPETNTAYRNIHMFLKRNEKWKCVAWQVTKVKEQG